MRHAKRLLHHCISHTVSNYHNHIARCLQIFTIIAIAWVRSLICLSSIDVLYRISFYIGYVIKGTHSDMTLTCTNENYYHSLWQWCATPGHYSNDLVSTGPLKNKLSEIWFAVKGLHSNIYISFQMMSGNCRPFFWLCYDNQKERNESLANIASFYVTHQSRLIWLFYGVDGPPRRKVHQVYLYRLHHDTGRRDNQTRVYRTWIRNYIPHCAVGCNKSPCPRSLLLISSSAVA